MVEIILDTVIKWRNAKEWRDVNRASALGFERVGDGKLIEPLLRDLLSAGKIADSDVVSIYRGATLCFEEKPVKTWFARRRQPDQLRRA